MRWVAAGGCILLFSAPLNCAPVPGPPLRQPGDSGPFLPSGAGDPSACARPLEGGRSPGGGGKPGSAAPFSGVLASAKPPADLRLQALGLLKVEPQGGSHVRPAGRRRGGEEPGVGGVGTGRAPGARARLRSLGGAGRRGRRGARGRGGGARGRAGPAAGAQVGGARRSAAAAI